MNCLTDDDIDDVNDADDNVDGKSPQLSCDVLS